MIFKERVYSVLIVSASESFNKSIMSMLPETDYYPVSVTSSVGAARRSLLERQYDFILINTPLPDDFGSRLAVDICSGSNSVALLFVRNELYDEIYSKVVDYGVMTLSKPISTQTVSQSLRMLCAMRERLRRLEKKTASVEEKMEEIRLVNRAKWTLISALGMTEADAHKYIEKQAMDRCVAKREIAEGIIKTYK